MQSPLPQNTPWFSRFYNLLSIKHLYILTENIVQYYIHLSCKLSHFIVQNDSFHTTTKRQFITQYERFYFWKQANRETKRRKLQLLSPEIAISLQRKGTTNKLSWTHHFYLTISQPHVFRPINFTSTPHTFLRIKLHFRLKKLYFWHYAFYKSYPTAAKSSINRG